MFGLFPRDKSFFDLFDRAANVVVKTAEAYLDTAKDYARREEHIARIRQCEHDGDEIVHITLDKLDTSFITPFDREDIHTLIKLMDDIVDEIDAASKRLILYRIDEPSKWLLKQAEVLLRASQLIAEAVSRLRDLRKLNGLQEKLVEIHRLENIGDENNHAAVAEMYERSKDAILVMKWKEIYDLTERAIDRCEDIANTIMKIILKNS